MTMNFTRNTVNRLIYVLLLIKLECIYPPYTLVGTRANFLAQHSRAQVFSLLFLVPGETGLHSL